MTTPTPTLNAWLDEWLALQRSQLKPSTVKSYTATARAYLRPTLGRSRLDELTTRLITTTLADLMHHGGRDGRRLSARTVEYVHSVLHKALRDAVDLDIIAANPATRARRPRHDPDTGPRPDHPVDCWDAATTRRFLTLSADHCFADLWRVALGTGMRRGELCGLRWGQLDLDVPQLTVNASLAFIDRRPVLTGTKTSRARTLHLDDDTARAIARQPRRPGNDLDLVFTRPDGTPLTPQQISDAWRHQWPELAGHGVPRLRLHATRHVHASLLLQQGVAMKVVSQRLGHATIAMTMNTYAHVLPAMDAHAADVMGALLDDPDGRDGSDRDGHGDAS